MVFLPSSLARNVQVLSLHNLLCDRYALLLACSWMKAIAGNTLLAAVSSCHINSSIERVQAVHRANVQLWRSNYYHPSMTSGEMQICECSMTADTYPNRLV